MRISDWSSDVCSSDLIGDHQVDALGAVQYGGGFIGGIRLDHRMAGRPQELRQCRAGDDFIFGDEDGSPVARSAAGWHRQDPCFCCRQTDTPAILFYVLSEP